MLTRRIGSHPFELFRSHNLPVFPVVLFACALAVLWITRSSMAWQTTVLRLVEQGVDANFGIGYAVTVADINRDGKTDIVAINATQAVWYENPTWKKHVIMDGLTKKDNVCVAAHDIDGDGPRLGRGVDANEHRDRRQPAVVAPA